MYKYSRTMNEGNIYHDLMYLCSYLSIWYLATLITTDCEVCKYLLIIHREAVKIDSLRRHYLMNNVGTKNVFIKLRYGNEPINQ
jgi:hypothetical protein